MNVSISTVSAAYDTAGKHIGIGPWLHVIHECNRTHPEMFGMPEIHSEGEYRESYADADVVFVGEQPQAGLVTITSKTPRGRMALTRAAESVGLGWRNVTEED